MNLRRLLCIFNRHQPNRALVSWDGSHYVGECRHCGAAIRRKAHTQWRREWKNGV